MIVYLCGGINALTDSQCNDRREYAIANLKCETLNPMRRDYRGREDEAYAEIIAGDKRDILASSAMLVNATRPSWGTAMEILFAYERKILVFAFTGDSKISPWLRYHATKLFRTEEEAVAHINRLIGERSKNEGEG